MTKCLVVLTAAIEPRQVPFLVRADPELRRADYRSALRHYASELSPKSFSLAVVENSGAEIDDLKNIASDLGHDLHTLSYRESDDVQRQGKGNAEAKMFDAVADAFLRGNERFDRVAKVTGRLTVRNVRRLLEAPRPERHIGARIRFDRTQLDTRFFVTDSLTWCEYFTGLEKSVNEPEGVFLEHVAALASARAVFAGVEWSQLRPQPIIAGYSGSTGYRYGAKRELLLDGVAWGAGRLLKRHYV